MSFFCCPVVKGRAQNFGLELEGYIQWMKGTADATNPLSSWGRAALAGRKRLAPVVKGFRLWKKTVRPGCDNEHFSYWFECRYYRVVKYSSLTRYGTSVPGLILRSGVWSPPHGRWDSNVTSLVSYLGVVGKVGNYPQSNSAKSTRLCKTVRDFHFS